jgi:hypothetical protein
MDTKITKLVTLSHNIKHFFKLKYVKTSYIVGYRVNSILRI